MIEFGLLGEIEARWNGKLLELGHMRQRSVLVVLLAEPNRVMSADQLVDRVWAQQPPGGARGTLYGYLYRLRQALAEASGVGIVRRSGGYALSVDPMAVDLHRFRGLISRARAADDERALALFDEALGLWRGNAFTGVDLPFVDVLRDTVNKERLAAQLDRNDPELRRRRHKVLLPGLAAMATTYPLNERVAGQLVLAQCRDGQGDQEAVIIAAEMLIAVRRNSEAVDWLKNLTDQRHHKATVLTARALEGLKCGRGIAGGLRILRTRFRRGWSYRTITS